LISLPAGETEIGELERKDLIADTKMRAEIDQRLKLMQIGLLHHGPHLGAVDAALAGIAVDECDIRHHPLVIGAAANALVDYYPIKLDIENVSRCNFRCTMCAVSDWPQRPPPFGLERNGAEAAPRP
jgi:hypothetical protein